MRLNIKRPKVVILDIEGTITAIDFVRKTLFLFIRQHLKDYLQQSWLNDELKSDIKLLREEAISMKKSYADVPLIADELADDEDIKASVLENVTWQMDRDLKTTSLKQLQGHIWKVGFENGLLKGHIFEDVSTMISQWKHNFDINFYIYSSGSVESQKLLMAHSVSGNLENLISGYFDTKIGPKVESQSYANILKELSLSADDVLFLTDVAKEAEAASDCGINCILVIRKGNTPLDEEALTRFKTMHTFEELDFV